MERQAALDEAARLNREAPPGGRVHWSVREVDGAWEVVSFETPGENMDREALDQLRGRAAMDDPRYGAHTMDELLATGAGAQARLVGPEPAC